MLYLTQGTGRQSRGLGPYANGAASTERDKVMQLFYGVPADIENWMELAERLRWNFPGLETQAGLDEYRATVLKFMDKRQALCVKAGGVIAGVMLFSRGHNMICCLGVSPDYRQRGIASMLMEEAFRNLDRRRDISVSTFRAEDEKGPAPRALYEKYGFAADALIEEMGYPSQKYILRPTKAVKTIEIHGANAYKTFSKTRVGCRGDRDKRSPHAHLARGERRSLFDTGRRSGNRRDARRMLCP